MFYLDVLDIRKFRYIFSNFRIGSHYLEIEVGRHKKILRETDYAQNVLRM
jgi:hypothetical protein